MADNTLSRLGLGFPDMRAWKLLVLVLLLPAICAGAYIYCELQNLPGCEKARSAGKRSEVALSLILLADKEQLEQAERDKGISQPVPDCPRVCRLVSRTLDEPFVLFTAFLAFVMLLQFIWMTRQESALSKSLAIAENALNRSERPQLFLIFEKRNFGPFRDEAVCYETADATSPPDISYRLHNFGRQPAILRKVCMACEFSPVAPDLTEVDPAADQVIPPQSYGEPVRCTFRPGWNFPRAEIKRLLAGESFFWFAARIEYSDAFGSSYETEVLWRYTMTPREDYFAPFHEGGRNRNT
ncbi:MAG: hypothetical protein ACXWUS_09675 [Burkholderiales bacterium]